MMVNE